MSTSSTVDARTDIVEYLARLRALLDSVPIGDIEAVISSLREAYEEGKLVFIIGNGGSAATASHMACDLAKTVLGEGSGSPRKRFRVIALTDNVPLLTAWANDESYTAVFSEQLRSLASEGDLLIAITGSGNSANIVEAVRVARGLGLRSAGLLGFDGGITRELVDHAVVIDADNYGRIEDMHMILNHLITAHFRRSFSVC